MLNGFLQYLQYEKNYSSHTVLSYDTDINQFFHFLKTDSEHFSLNDVEPVMIQQWILEMMQQGMSARSISRKVSALKSFWNYLLKQNFTQVNPTLKIVLPKTKKPLPAFFKHREVSQVITDPHIPQDNFERIRDVLIVAVFYMTGIRLSELINIQENDVDVVAGELRVIGKRNKERIIPLDKLLCEKISIYIDKKEDLVGPGTSYLFVRANGMKMYPKLVSNIIRKLMSQVSTLPQISPHVLRHSFATALLDGGADINAVKELLGHSSLAATQVYTHTGFETLHNIYKQAHPRAK
ncbi:MAG TPA: tyrosine-type recombinase/integrase [Paludibacter sp.]|nr:MAG: Tyrosine recombinase XerC [Bacteroidetes bacterium ADurb.Bin174]HQB28397.1 tyrosine-type recombinase/integrase [Paludibacter sp.]